ncbi:probable tRNA modification GTPase (TrmE) [Desulfotalea psychrophila LSv54]|nr:probable tRNA modification GTPase (TrmE) [Desulfotalea psychrophila LSv54]
MFCAQLFVLEHSKGKFEMAVFPRVVRKIIEINKTMAISYADNETIAAISTPMGTGGIGVIRISGKESLTILQTIFRPHNDSCSYRSHQMYYGQIVAADGHQLDEVLVVYMRAPKTYTCEDIVEIHCHGNFLVLQNVLELVIEKGASLAEPGEFTKRAFFNGRIDLTKAEAVIDVLSAKTRKGVDVAQEQLAGSLYRRIEPIRNALVHMRALFEVAIDFPDQSHDIVDYEQIDLQLKTEVIAPVKELLAGVDRGRIYRQGISMVIAGRPNVGKSSLLNAVLQEERALVTSIAGTTRDSIEEMVDILGMPVRIVDTAGIRRQAGEVEALGIQRAKDLINSADLVLFMVDGSRQLDQSDLELYEDIAHKPMIAVINKLDLLAEDGTAAAALLDFVPASVPRLAISAREGEGLEALKQAIFTVVTGSDTPWDEEGCAPNLRHKKSLEATLIAAERMVDDLAQGMGSSDLLSIDMQECLDQLGDIIGITTTDDVFDVIFSEFCLGK